MRNVTAHPQAQWEHDRRPHGAESRVAAGAAQQQSPGAQARRGLLGLCPARNFQRFIIVMLDRHSRGWQRKQNTLEMTGFK